MTYFFRGIRNYDLVRATVTLPARGHRHTVWILTVFVLTYRIGLGTSAEGFSQTISPEGSNSAGRRAVA